MLRLLAGAVPVRLARCASTAAASSRRRRKKRYNSLKLLHINDVYELDHLPRLSSLRKRLQPHAVVLSGDFLSPSVLSSLDGGRSMIEALNAAGVTHCCLGNHEADVPLKTLYKRAREFKGTMLCSNVQGLDPLLFRRRTNLRDCTLVGLLSAEQGVFKDGTFKGLTIAQPAEALQVALGTLKHPAKRVVALTHQSWDADAQLACTSLTDGTKFKLILGGHDHEVGRRWVGTLADPYRCLIVKSGSDAQTASFVHYRYPRASRARVDVSELDLSEEPEDPEVRAICARLIEPVRQLETQVLIHHAGPLRSVRVRQEQTSMGALLCSTCRDELEVDCCFINGGPIKGDSEYPDGKLTLLHLRRELPFPTKLVTVRMTGAVLSAAVKYSRVHGAKTGGRGFLQVDDRCKTNDAHELVEIAGAPTELDRHYQVAIPRNLIAGFCSITPLVKWGESHPDLLPHQESYQPALSVVIRHFARALWRGVVGSRDFSEFDTNNDGVIDRAELSAALAAHFGSEPSGPLVDAVVGAIDTDRSETVDRAEFEAATAATA